MFYNRNMGNVEYDNTLRLAPNAYQVGTDFWAGGDYGNGLGPDLRHGARGDAGQPHRQHRHQLADAGLVQVARRRTASACRTRGGSRGTRWSRRATSARAAATWSAAATATSCRYGALQHRAPSTASTCRSRSTAYAVASVGDQPGVVPAVQRAERHHALRLRRRVELQLDAGHAEPADRPAAAVLRRLHARPHRGHARRRVLARSTRTTRAAPTASSTRTAPTSSTCRGTRSCRMARKGGMDNAFGRGLLNGWQLSGISSLASGIPIRLELQRRRRQRRIAAAYFGTADVVGPSNGGGNGLAPVYTCDPRLGGNEVGEKILDINCISVPGVRRERRPGAAVQHPHADADQPRPDPVQELRDHGRPEDAVPRRVLQPVQPGVRQHDHRRRHQPDARHDLQRDACTDVPNGAGGTVTTSATRPRASTSRRRRRPTSARSTSSAATASSSSC